MRIASSDRVKQYFEEDLGMSPESHSAIQKLKSISSHYYFPVSRHNNLVTEFYNLYFQWKQEVKYASTTLEICMNPNYQKIIGMGEKVLPLLFFEIENRPDHWLWALKAITGADPIQPKSRGKLKEMCRDWLVWAKQQDLDF